MGWLSPSAFIIDHFFIGRPMNWVLVHGTTLYAAQLMKAACSHWE